MPDSAAKNRWHKHRFDEMALMVNDRIDDPTEADVDRYVGLEHLDSESLAIRRWGLPSDVEATKLRFRAGDIIFGRRRVYQRKLAVADFDGICSAHAMVLRARPGVVLPEFLPFFMQSDLFMERAKEISVGSLSPTINWKTLAMEEFALPPIQEQMRIIHTLKAAQQHLLLAVDLHQSVKRLLSSLQKRYFIDEPNGREMEIGEFATVRNGSTPPRGRKEYWSGQLPWLPTGKVNERRISSADEFITQQALDECPLSIIPNGATLVAMIGEGQTRGRAAFLKIDACINQNFGAVIPDASVDPTFLFFLLESQYEALRHWSQGTNQHALNCKLISSFRVRVPHLDQQRSIAAALQEVDSAAELASERVKAARFIFNLVTTRVLMPELD